MPRHAFDALSFAFALIFGTFAVTTLFGFDALGINFRWLAPLGLVLVGLILLLPVGRRRAAAVPAGDPLDSTLEAAHEELPERIDSL